MKLLNTFHKSDLQTTIYEETKRTDCKLMRYPQTMKTLNLFVSSETYKSKLRFWFLDTNWYLCACVIPK